jgi:hypothetical protein
LQSLFHYNNTSLATKIGLKTRKKNFNPEIPIPVKKLIPIPLKFLNPDPGPDPVGSKMKIPIPIPLNNFNPDPDPVAPTIPNTKIYY